MTVKEIFELRRQGRIEEAYEAIRPMYAAHKGRYTTLCMFWTAADIFKKRLEEGRTEEATLIFEALKRVFAYIKDCEPAPDKDGIPVALGEDRRSTAETAAGFMQYAARRMAKVKEKGLQNKEKQSETPADGSLRKSGAELATVTTPEFEPQQQAPDTKPDSKAQLTFGVKQNPERKESSESEEVPENNGEQKTEDVQSLESESSDHLIVSLDDGIIRPIDGINAIQRIILSCIVGHPGYSVPKISDSTGIPQKTIESHVAILISKSLVEHRGSNKTGGYYPL